MLVFVFLVGPSWSTHQFFQVGPSPLSVLYFLGLCWDTVHMSVSLPPDKLADIQQLALSLLWTPHVTVHKVMSFLSKANFCTNGHSQLWLTQLFSHVHFSLSSLHQLEWLAKLQQSPVPLQFYTHSLGLLFSRFCVTFIS